MTCSEFTELLEAFAGHDLSPAEVAEFERHLHACEECTAYMDAYRRAVAMGRKAFDDRGGEVQGVVPESLVRAILASRKR